MADDINWQNDMNFFNKILNFIENMAILFVA